MIIWRGAGFLVAVITFGALLASEYTTELIFKDETYYQAHGWPKLMAFFIAGAIVWLVGIYFNKRPAKVMIDKETGQEVLFKPNHSLFFINMEYWGPILFVLGIIFLFVTE